MRGRTTASWVTSRSRRRISTSWRPAAPFSPVAMCPPRCAGRALATFANGLSMRISIGSRAMIRPCCRRMPPRRRPRARARRRVTARPTRRCAKSSSPISTSTLPLPELLGEQGYLSHQSGKWWEGDPKRAGFTHGMTRGFPNPGGRHGDDGLKIGREGMEPVFEFIDHAIAEKKPFFLWYAPFMPHTPHTPPDRLFQKYKAKGIESDHVARYYAMVEWFDETCGQLHRPHRAKGAHREHARRLCGRQRLDSGSGQPGLRPALQAVRQRRRHAPAHHVLLARRHPARRPRRAALLQHRHRAHRPGRRRGAGARRTFPASTSCPSSSPASRLRARTSSAKPSPTTWPTSTTPRTACSTAG